jgi:hypothetical protein
MYKIAADKRCSLPTKLSAALYMDQPLRLNTSQAITPGTARNGIRKLSPPPISKESGG